METATRIHCPIAHIDETAAVEHLLAALAALHGPAYGFAVGRWTGGERWAGKPGRMVYRFVVQASDAAVAGLPGELVRGLPPMGPYAQTEPEAGIATAPWQEALWPGDVVCLEPGVTLVVGGRGAYFEVETEAIQYPAPRVAFLRYLGDKPGGCAAYLGAFRREALPPVRSDAGVADQRGANRVNEHTLDMRMDREPPPSRHHHAAVPVGPGDWVNHSETAIVLPRALYRLPEVDGEDAGLILLYVRPDEDPTDVVEVAVRPGTLVVTPAARDGAAGHCFANAFAMLVAIPGFVSTYQFMPAPS